MRNGSGVPRRKVGMSGIVVFRIRIYSGIGPYGRCSRFLTGRKSGGRRGALECERAVALTHDEGALRRDLRDSVGVEAAGSLISASKPQGSNAETVPTSGFYFGPNLKVERH